MNFFLSTSAFPFPSSFYLAFYLSQGSVEQHGCNEDFLISNNEELCVSFLCCLEVRLQRNNVGAAEWKWRGVSRPLTVIEARLSKLAPDFQTVLLLAEIGKK